MLISTLTSTFFNTLVLNIFLYYLNILFNIQVFDIIFDILVFDILVYDIFSYTISTLF
jgi:hypothetical protein